MSRNYHTDNKSFMMYKDWEELIDCLDSDEDAGRLLKALFAFAARGEDPDFESFTGALRMAYIVMRASVERDGERWEETCAARSEAGRQGGRHKKAKEANAFPEKQKQAKEADTDTVTATDTVTVTERAAERVAETPPLLAPSARQALIRKYGADITELYIRKLSSYIAEKRGGTPYNDNAAIIEKWISEDKQNGRLKDLCSFNGKSYDIDEFESFLDSYMPKLTADAIP